MSPNANYLKGVRFERERQKYYKEVLKLDCLRTAGSRGKMDLIAIDPLRSIVTLIQCKTCQDSKHAERLLNNFRANPPYAPMANIHQVLEVKVKGSKDVRSVTI